MLSRERRRHHALTNRLEDFGLSEIRYQESEGECVGDAPHFDIGSGSRPTLDQPRELQVSDGPSHGDSRGAERALELGLARQPIARFEPAGLDFTRERVEHFLVLGGFFYVSHAQMI